MIDTKKAYRGVEIGLWSFLTSTADEAVWSTPRPGHFTLRKRIIVSFEQEAV